jgi:hypothetical protein
MPAFIALIEHKLFVYSQLYSHFLCSAMTRHLFIRQQTAVINSIRAYLAEFGIVAHVGRRGVEQLEVDGGVA